MRRIAFGVGHLFVDVMLLMAFVHQGKTAWAAHDALPIVASTESPMGTFDWLPERPVPGLFRLLQTGTLPAGWLSVMMRPKAYWLLRDQLWDPVWLVIHEAIALPLWFLLAGWIDEKWMHGYLAARFLLAGLAIAFGGGEYYAILQAAFWLGLVGIGGVRLVGRP